MVSNTLKGLRQVTVSDFRRGLADYFVEAVYRNHPLVLTRHEKEWAVLLGSDVFTSLLDAMGKSKIPLPVETLPEDDGSITLSCPALSIYGNGPTPEDAREDFFATDYLSNLDVYLRDPVHKRHFAFLLLLTHSDGNDASRLFSW